MKKIVILDLKFIIYFNRFSIHTFGARMGHQINVLQEFKKPTKRGIEEIDGIPIKDLNGCRHALWLSHGVYCALRREKIDGDTCEGCPHFDPEPLEYRLFRRM